jgi:hypothetical protein
MRLRARPAAERLPDDCLVLWSVQPAERDCVRTESREASYPTTCQEEAKLDRSEGRAVKRRLRADWPCDLRSLGIAERGARG